MSDLFSADALRDFILNGYVVIPPSEKLPASFHKELYDHTKSICNKYGHRPPKEPQAQRELWQNPAMSEVIAAPEVHAALEAILGPGYVVYPHRHMHTTTLQAGQEWHQDPTMFPIRTVRPRQVLAMYYPGDVSMSDGPTSFLPGSHYMQLDMTLATGTVDLVQGQFDKMIKCYRTKDKSAGVEFEAEVNESHVMFDNSQAGDVLGPKPGWAVVKGGSWVINHYEIIHRGTLLYKDGQFRPMYKFLVLRSALTRAMPSMPVSFPELPNRSPSEGQLAIWKCVWEWAVGVTGSADEDLDTSSVVASLSSGKLGYIEALGKAFLLARAARAGNTAALDALIQGMQGDNQLVRLSSMMALPEVGRLAIERVLPLFKEPLPAVADKNAMYARIAATYVLSEIGRSEADELYQQVAAAAAAQIAATCACLRPATNGALDAVVKVIEGDAQLKNDYPWIWQKDLIKTLRMDPKSFLQMVNVGPKTAPLVDKVTAVLKEHGVECDAKLGPSDGERTLLNQLLMVSCCALGGVAQALAGKDGPALEDLLIKIKDALSLVVPVTQMKQDVHKPLAPDLLALAAASACYSSQARMDAHIDASTPPIMSSDRFAGMFLTVAVARWKAVGGNDKVAAILQEMIDGQKQRLTSENRPKPQSGVEDYEKNVFPQMFCGDHTPFYNLGGVCSPTQKPSTCTSS